MCRHPLVIWLPDYTVTTVTRFAPDLSAWRSGSLGCQYEQRGGNAVPRLEQCIWRDQPWHALTNLTTKARLLRRRQLESLLDDCTNIPDDLRLTRQRTGILADLGDVCVTGARLQKCRLSTMNGR